jgi:RHS repeat-associated protein
MVTITGKGCSGNPKPIRHDFYPVYPAKWFGNTYPLPTTIQPLVQPPAGGKPDFSAVWAFGGVPMTWSLSFTLDPIIDPNVDDPCEWIVGSSVACQNQSLGQDLPVTGTGLFLHYESNRTPGALIAGSAASPDVLANGGWTFNVHHVYDPTSQRLYLGNGEQRSHWQLGTVQTLNGNPIIAARDGSEVYVFDPTTGNHIKTLKSLTGALKYQFTYDTSGRLITIADANGNATSIKRGSNGLPTAIVSPYGQTTNLTMDSNGFMKQVTDPAGHIQSFVYTSKGLMTSRTDADLNTYTYAYDSSGTLIKDAPPSGGSTTLGRTSTVSGGTIAQTVTGTTPMGRASTFQTIRNVSWADNGSSYAEHRVNTWPNGLQAHDSKTLQSGQISETTALPDGKSASLTQGPDPRWGIQVPVPTRGSLTLGSLTMNVTHTRTAAFTAGNPFSLTSQTEVETINGQQYKSAYTSSNRTYTETSPVGRKLTTVLDSQERIASAQVPGLSPTNFTYDTRGRLSSLIHGTGATARTTSLTYDTDGRLATTSDPLGRKTSFNYDADGNLIERILPDNRMVNYSYDANGNVTSITPPSKLAHDFSYDSVGLLAAYNPPSIPGGGPVTYTYNLDHQISSVTRPDAKTITFSYDSAGRIDSIATATTTTDYSYGQTTGLLASSAVVGGETINYSYNGPLLSAMAWTGAIAGSVGHTYDNNFHVISRTVNGGNSIAFQYDNDGIMTNAGALALTRSTTNGLLTGTALAVEEDSFTYNSFGEVTGYSAVNNGSAVYATQLTRDALGRITAKSETLSGVTTAFTYSYDTPGRLTSVSKNGKVISTYTYDGNSNRITVVTSAGTVNATYDSQDRLINYGTTKYSYTANGEVASQTVGLQITTYQYDGTGNLLGATLPNGTHITYVLDGKGRRVGVKVGGVLVQGFLYDGSRPVAQLNGNNQLVSQFVYATRANVPDYMVKGAATYRIFSDHLGSPRLVIDISTHQIAEHIDYDEFGNVLVDTNPGFQPFGFAGGLYDKTTELVHFGSREYAPAIGRWLTKDPILFAGGDTNLYEYTLADPINLTDSDGNESIGISAYEGIGGGITVTWSDGRVSIGVELGVGTPTVGVGNDPGAKVDTGEEMGRRTGDPEKLTIFGEAGGELSFPVPFGGKITLIDGKVGVEIEESPCPGKFEPPKGKGKICVGTDCIGPEGPTHQLEGETPESHHEGESKSTGTKLGFGGKAGVKINNFILF